MSSQPSIIVEGSLRIPRDVFTLEEFQAWVYSGDFPETGRIDFIAGDVEVDMSPENVQTHAPVKTAIVGTLADLVVAADRGELYIDSTRVVCPEPGLSVEPDVVVVLWESFEGGRVRFSGSGPGAPPTALAGAPDLVVEIVSDSSVRKDTKVLPVRYAQAGVAELWLADARGANLSFEIHALREGRYEAVQPDAEGWLRSPRLGNSFRLLRTPARHGHWRYVLERRSS